MNALLIYPEFRETHGASMRTQVSGQTSRSASAGVADTDKLG